MYISLKNNLIVTFWKIITTQTFVFFQYLSFISPKKILVNNYVYIHVHRFYIQQCTKNRTQK